MLALCSATSLSRIFVSSLANAGYAPGLVGLVKLVPPNRTVYLVSGTTILICPNVPPPMVVEMVTRAAVNCVVSLLMSSSVGWPSILVSSNALRASNTSYKTPMIALIRSIAFYRLVTTARQRQRDQIA